MRWLLRRFTSDEELVSAGTLFIGSMLLLLWTAQFCTGIGHANKMDECNLKNIGEVIVSPVYILGCNIGKNRFNWKVN